MPKISTIEDIQHFEREMSLAARNLPHSTYEMLERGAAVSPDAPALKFFLRAEKNSYRDTEVYRFREMMQHIRQTANLFHQLGIGKDDVVSFVLPNLPETHWTIWGAERVGIVNPINPLLEPKQIAHIMQSAGTKVLVTLGPFPKTDLWEKVDSIRDQVPSLKTVLRVNLLDHLGGAFKFMVSMMLWGKQKARKVGGQKVYDFNALKKQARADALDFDREIHPDDIASYFHTGGTTGLPKLAMHSHRNEVYDSWAMMQFLGAEHASGKSFFCGLPLFHVNGVMVTGLGPWSAGACVLLGSPSGYRTKGLFENFWKIVDHYKVTFFSGVPAVYAKLLEVPTAGADISSLEFAICGAAPMPVEVIRKFEEKTGLRLLEGYGCTEGTCASAVNPPHGERRPGSVGFPFPYQAMKVLILDPQGRYERDAQTDEIGAIAIRGANVFAGYKEPAQNEGIWIDDGKGQGPWYNTGDLGRQDAEGYFWLTGRKKELIIRGGHNIDPKLIEEPMHQHPAVELCAAVGRPDVRVGEIPVAYIQLKPGMQASPQDLYDFAKTHISESAAVPKMIHIVDQMPLTAIGKIFKPALVRGEIRSVFEEELAQIEGLGVYTVSVIPDSVHGVKALINLHQPQPQPQAIKAMQEVLGKYPVYYETAKT